MSNDSQQQQQNRSGLPDVEQLRRAYRGGEVVLASSRALWTHGAGKAGSKALTKTLGKAALPLAAVDAALSVRDAVVSHQAWKREELATGRLQLATEAQAEWCNAAERHLTRQLVELSGQVDQTCDQTRTDLRRLDGVAAGRQAVATRLDLLRTQQVSAAEVRQAERQFDRMTDLALALLAEPTARPRK
jgi:hypothetical protein